MKPIHPAILEALAARWSAEAGHLGVGRTQTYCDALRACAAELRVLLVEEEKPKPGKGKP